MAKWVYAFGNGEAEGRADMKRLLGGKGANLAQMSNVGLPVPPGFTITTQVCARFFADGERLPPELRDQVEAALERVAALTGRIFGDGERPLLVSVRSGAPASMPGMLDTVLNLGLNETTVSALARASGDERFALDSWRRFIQMYANVVLGVDLYRFEELLDDYKERRGYLADTDMTASDWRKLLPDYQAMVLEASGAPFPDDPREQLWGAIAAVFKSWMTPRAATYRRLHAIPEDWGTAVNVQAMVFGNMGETSATGVAFTRDPSTGEKALFGEFLINAQGEDVVAGARTPQSITEAARLASKSSRPSMEAAMPRAFAEFRQATELLERHCRDMQDMEFTIERGKLWMLQTRDGKRTAKAAIRIAVDMAKEGLITKQEAIARIDPASLDQLLHPTIDPKADRLVLANGLPASPGAATGEIVFASEEAEKLKSEGRRAILVRVETSPEDIRGMDAAQGVLTTRGGMTSHAAVIARGMGKPCVCGAGGVRVDYAKEIATVAGRVLKKGDVITIDGATGQVLLGAVRMLEPELSGEFGELMAWADAVRTMQVRANAETPADAGVARRFGAQGLGLCRTERMFFDGDRIGAAREMILADDEIGRRAALAKLLPTQRGDFERLFEIMGDLPVAIRLLDPPLREFLPQVEEEIARVADAMGVSADKLKRRAAELHEVNPMLGLRGCRLAIAYPEIAEMQARAVFEAASATKRRVGRAPSLEMLVPFVLAKAELDFVKDRIDAVARAVTKETGVQFDYAVGAMIELPRAALRAGEISQSAEFFSFGTNDLTQTALGLSRDDAGAFLGAYVARGLLAADPFTRLDVEGAGELIKIAVERGRAARPGLKLGLCGEHGGDPAAIAFCCSIGLDYVSCSPFRVPVARLAAAQAALAAGASEKGKKTEASAAS